MLKKSAGIKIIEIRYGKIIIGKLIEHVINSYYTDFCK